MSRKQIFFAVVALQILSLFGMIGFKSSVLITGQTIILKSVPVDPRDLMRGDYVRIRWAIADLDRMMKGDGAKLEIGDGIYVLLEKGNPDWKPTAISSERPSLDEDQAVIKGTVIGLRPLSIQVDYGMDSYYVPEGKGREYERIKYWEVKVNRRGNAVLKGPYNK
jgi:uncharacterized membrane-anchored protein